MPEMKYWGQLSDGSYVKYEGMTQEAINAMLSAQGLTLTYMTESDWNTAVGG